MQAEASEKQKALEERDMAVFQEAGGRFMCHANIGRYIICICSYMHGCMSTCMYGCKDVCMYVRMYVCTCVCMNVCLCAYA